MVVFTQLFKQKFAVKLLSFCFSYTSLLQDSVGELRAIIRDMMCMLEQQSETLIKLEVRTSLSIYTQDTYLSSYNYMYYVCILIQTDNELLRCQLDRVADEQGFQKSK